MGGRGFRIASVRVAAPAEDDGRGLRLGTALLAASPRTAVAGPGLCRADARGWGRRGGEEALARALRRAAEEAGFGEARVGVADAPVAADAAAALAAGSPLLVPPGGDAAFLAPLPLAFLPLPEELRETFRALGLRRIGEVAGLEPRELEARFGPEGVRAGRLARGEDDRPFLPLDVPELPEARLELEGPAAELEPLLFVLRHLLGRIHQELAGEGRCAARLELELESEGSRPVAAGPEGGGRARCGAGKGTARGDPLRIPIVPARPTAREEALFDLCRAALEREFAGSGGRASPRRGGRADPRSGARSGRIGGPVAALALRVLETAPAEARQGDLFGRGPRDPLAAAATLSRLRARLGEEGVVRPAPRPGHRPERRNGWVPVDRRPATARTGPEGRVGAEEGLPPVLRLLPRPAPVEVGVEEGRPVWLDEGAGRRCVTAAEGPERLSGDWWGAAYGREYWRLATAEGELLWAFREPREDGARWRLHGWWD